MRKHRHVDSDKIANSHGCYLETGGFGGRCIVVQPYWQQGNPQDAARIAKCRAALEAAGVDTTGWLS